MSICLFDEKKIGYHCGLGTEVRKRRVQGWVEESGVHWLLLNHNRLLSQADQGETRLLLYYVHTK